MAGLGMQEILLLGICSVVPVGILAAVLIVMRLSKKSPRDADDRVEREDIDDRD